jgi:penicillin amidase
MPEYFISAEGSNAWVVSGEHTESGKPILSGDPHLDSSLPGHWYQFKATYTSNNKTVRYAGVAPPGIMMTHGKSDYYAVGLAVLQTDTQDLYK